MTEIVSQSNFTVPRPLPSVDVRISAGTLDDVPFLDSLQKLHTKQVGWMPTATLAGKITCTAATPLEEEGAARMT